MSARTHNLSLLSLVNLFSYPGELALWIIYLALFPLYFFPSGNPQVADFYIVVVIGFFILQGKLKAPAAFRTINRTFLFLLGYIAIVNLSLFVVRTGLPSKGLPWYVITSFYLYNYLVFRLVLALYARHRGNFIRATVAGLLFGALMTVLVDSGSASGGTIRGSLSFQTSNQLGYYSLILLSVLLLLQKVVRIPALVIYVVTGLCFYMAATSISNAAIFSVVILFGIFILDRGLLNLRTISFLLVVGLGGLFLLFNTEFGQSTIARYQYRVDTSVRESAGVSEVEYRGYDRMFNHPEYMILGAGEGAYNRFDTFIENHEMHSSFGTILFCYGIPGFTLFLLLIYRCLKGLRLGVVVYTLPIFAYGVTHMGLRFTVFWIAMALFPILRHYSWEAFQQQKRLREEREQAVGSSPSPSPF